jgi:hypothetical protein
MPKLVLVLLLISTPALSQASADLETAKKEFPQLQAAVNDVMTAGVPGIWVLHAPKAAYLDGYGVVVSMEVALERPRNPFSTARPADELRVLTAERRKQIRDKLADFLKARMPALQSVGPTESMTIVVHFLNTNPADLPDVPSQLILSLKKQNQATGGVQVREF